MSEDPTNQTKPKPRWGMIASYSAAALIIVFLAGVWFGSYFRPNHITFFVEPGANPRATLAPRVNDDITWKDQQTGQSVPVNFAGDTPCPTSASPGSTCLITKLGQFEYQCVKVDAQGNITGTACIDPGVDPQTSLGPTLDDLKLPFKNAFGWKTSAMVTESRISTPAVAQRASNLSTADTVYPAISCDTSSKALVVTPGGISNANDSLSVWTGQYIHWRPGSLSNFKVQVDSTICTPSTPDQDNPECQVVQTTTASDLSYSITTTDSSSACKSGNGSLTIVARPAPAP